MEFKIRHGGTNDPEAHSPMADGIIFAVRAGGSVSEGKKNKNTPEPPPGYAIEAKSGGRHGGAELSDDIEPTWQTVDHRLGGSKKLLPISNANISTAARESNEDIVSILSEKTAHKEEM